MKGRRYRKIAAMIALAVCLNGRGADMVSAENVVVRDDRGVLSQTVKNVTFENPSAQTVEIKIYANVATQAAVKLVQTDTTQVVKEQHITPVAWKYEEGSKNYSYCFQNELVAGTYQLQLQSEGSFSYQVSVYAVEPEESFSLKKKKLTLMAGHTEKLIATSAENVEWESNHTKVATVDKNGVVTAKRAGKAVITADYNDTSVSCQVIVKKNQYKGKKLTLSNTGTGIKLRTYKAEYKNGSVVCRVAIVNHTAMQLRKVDQVRLQIQDAGSRQQVSYSSRPNIKMAPYSVKTVRIVIPGGKFAGKNINLKRAKIKTTGHCKASW